MAYCDRCDRSFVSEHALWQHEEASSMHWFCRDCDRDFTSNSALIQHMVNSSRHHYCRSCEEDFDDEDDLEDHYAEDHHYCRSCSEVRTLISHLCCHRVDKRCSFSIRSRRCAGTKTTHTGTVLPATACSRQRTIWTSTSNRLYTNRSDTNAQARAVAWLSFPPLH